MNVVLAVIFCARAILLVFKKLIVLTGIKKGAPYNIRVALFSTTYACAKLKPFAERQSKGARCIWIAREASWRCRCWKGRY